MRYHPSHECVYVYAKDRIPRLYSQKFPYVEHSVFLLRNYSSCCLFIPRQGYLLQGFQLQEQVKTVHTLSEPTSRLRAHTHTHP